MASAAIAAIPAAAVPVLPPAWQSAVTQPAANVSFGQFLLNGMEGVNKKLLDADNVVRAFALDDTVPVHQVMFALDQAKASMELALQVRARLLDGYQQLMNMQI